MPDPVDYEELRDDVAQKPAATTNFDGSGAQQHNLKDLDEVAARRQQDRAVRKQHRGLFFSKLVPPGAT